MTNPPAPRVPNRTLRAVRLELGLSQTALALKIQQAGDEAGEPNACNQRLIQHWENGEYAQCQMRYRRALQQVTGRPYDQLGFQGAAPAPTQSHTMRPTSPATLLTPAGQGAYLRFALRAPVTVSDEHVQLAEAATRHLYDRERHTPASRLFASADRQLSDIALLLAGTEHDALRRRLALSAGYCAALTGYLAFDQGDPDTAARYWDSAHAAARDAADPGLKACLLTFQAQQAEQDGNPAVAWQLTMTATGQARCDPRAHAWTTIHAAHYAATLGQRTSALTDLHEALTLTVRLPQLCPDTAPWVRGVDVCAVVTMAASVYARLGDDTGAHAMAKRIRDTLGHERTKTRALALARLSHLTAHANDLSATVRTARTALQLATELDSTAARRVLHALAPMLAAHHSNTDVRDLLEGISQLTTSHPPPHDAGNDQPHPTRAARRLPVPTSANPTKDTPRPPG